MQFTDLKTQYAALKSDIDARIQRVLDHGQYIMGPEVAELEAALCGFTGSKHCITVSSGTEALLIALMALDLAPGDEVITTPFTFAATAEMIVLAGAKPVFVDIEPDTCNIDVSLIEAKITPRTKAIMPVSLYGQVADMDAINAIAARHGLAVIEDAAQSFGALYQGRRSCALSTFGATSFFPSKPLGCYGDGGALFTDDDTLAAHMATLVTEPSHLLGMIRATRDWPEMETLQAFQLKDGRRYERHVTPQRLQRHCLRGEGPADGLVQIRPALRERVRFGQLNLCLLVINYTFLT